MLKNVCYWETQKKKAGTQLLMVNKKKTFNAHSSPESISALRAFL